MARAPVTSLTGISAARAAEQARLDERLRAQAILNSPEGRAHPALAHECITQGFSVTQATGVLRAAGKPASSVYLEALEAQAIGITGPASSGPAPVDPRAARMAEIAAAGATFRAERGRA